MALQVVNTHISTNLQQKIRFSNLKKLIPAALLILTLCSLLYYRKLHGSREKPVTGYRKIEDFLVSEKLVNSRQRRFRESRDTHHNKRRMNRCNCFRGDHFVDMETIFRRGSSEAVPMYVNIGHCRGSCNAGVFGMCNNESGHTRVKRLMNRVSGRSSGFRLKCVPIKFEPMVVPLRNSDGSYTMERFLTLVASECGCRWFVYSCFCKLVWHNVKCKNV